MIRRAKKKHARGAQSSNDIDEADLFFVVIGRTNFEQKKVRQSTNTQEDDDDDFLCAFCESLFE